LGIQSPTCINYSLGKFDADTVNNFALQNGQKYILDTLQKLSAGFINEIDSNLTKLSLRNFLIYCNDAAALQKNLSQ